MVMVIRSFGIIILRLIVYLDYLFVSSLISRGNKRHKIIAEKCRNLLYSGFPLNHK